MLGLGVVHSKRRLNSVQTRSEVFATNFLLAMHLLLFIVFATCQPQHRPVPSWADLKAISSHIRMSIRIVFPTGTCSIPPRGGQGGRLGSSRQLKNHAISEIIHSAEYGASHNESHLLVDPSVPREMGHPPRLLGRGL